MQNEIRKYSVRQQASHTRTGEGSVEGPQAGADEVEKRPGGQCQASCQAHGLQQLLYTPTVWVNTGMDSPKHDPCWRQTLWCMGPISTNGSGWPTDVEHGVSMVLAKGWFMHVLQVG